MLANRNPEIIEVNTSTQTIIKKMRKGYNALAENGAKITGVALLMLAHTMILNEVEGNSKCTDRNTADFWLRHLKQINSVIIFLVATPAVMNVAARTDDLNLDDRSFRIRQRENHITSLRHPHPFFHRHEHHQHDPIPTRVLINFSHNEFKMMVIGMAMMTDYLFQFVDPKDRSSALIIAFLALTRVMAMAGVVYADRFDEVAWNPAVIRERHLDNIFIWDSVTNFFWPRNEVGIEYASNELNVTSATNRL
jgi:uncharacterized membrane protein